MHAQTAVSSRRRPDIASRQSQATNIEQGIAYASSGDHLADPLGVDSLADTPGGGGSPLPDGLRTRMEASFGADFSGVRVHQDARPASIGAAALTRGQDLHFQPGRYDPDGAAGQRLIGHELAHVVQQRGGVARSSGEGASVEADPGLESEADTAGARAAGGLSADVGGAGQGWGGGAAPIQCKPRDEKAAKKLKSVADVSEALGEFPDVPVTTADAVLSPIQTGQEVMSVTGEASKGMQVANNVLGGVGAGLGLLGAVSTGARALGEQANLRNAETVAGRGFARSQRNKALLETAIQATGGGLGIAGVAGGPGFLGAIGSGIETVVSGAKAVDSTYRAVKTRKGGAAGSAISSHKENMLDARFGDTAPTLDPSNKVARETYLKDKRAKAHFWEIGKKKKINRELNTLENFDAKAKTRAELDAAKDRLGQLTAEQKAANAKVPWYKRMVGIGTNKNKAAINEQKQLIQGAREAKEAEYGVAKAGALQERDPNKIKDFKDTWGDVREARRLERARGTLHGKFAGKAAVNSVNAVGGAADTVGSAMGPTGLIPMAVGKGVKATVAATGLGARMANRWGRARDLGQAEEMLDNKKKASKWGTFKRFINPLSKFEDRRGDIAKDARRAIEAREGGAQVSDPTLQGMSQAQLDELYKKTTRRDQRHGKQFTNMLTAGTDPNAVSGAYTPNTSGDQLQGAARKLAGAAGMGPNGEMRKMIAGKDAGEQEKLLRDQWYGAKDARDGDSKKKSIMNAMWETKMEVF